ncbi:MAG: hypothetical protein JW847_08060 [Candidatus Omnitrophica bacterium]|nr:hypothetical protein [Candidatus Omnitrophota bacterium]
MNIVAVALGANKEPEKNKTELSKTKCIAAYSGFALLAFHKEIITCSVT